MSDKRRPFFGRPVSTSRPAEKTTAPAPAPASAPAPSRPEAAAAEHRFPARDARYRLDDVVLPDPVREGVSAVLAKLNHRRTLYDHWGLRRIDPYGGKAVLNFYGPPGTGKSMLAEAVAERLGQPIIEVNYAEVESKYVGETPKNITAAFKSATDQGAALFFDEADSILGKRMTQVTQASDHSVNVSRAVMLKQLDAHDGVVLFATNLAKNIDGAFVRRILYHIEVPAPDREGRRLLFEKLMPPELPGRDTVDLDALADASEGLVGGEIKNIIIIAATLAVQRRGDERVVRDADLLKALERVAQARREVGSFTGLGD